ncbi:MFS transporter [Streptosporangium longisporum]|uniref:MFS transporter n=1 Tax=Streptosporangium longisporum TaxID=46187 RepID=A0ABP6KMY8_9ACTN
MRLYLLARTVSWIGSSITLVALPILLYQRTGSAALSGLLTALEAIPYLLFGLPAGALADRWDRRRTLTLTSWTSAALIASVPAASALEVLTTAHLFLVAGATATAFVFFDAAAFGALPALVGREGVARATSTLMTAGTLVTLIGPAVAGVLVAAVGAPAAMGADALSYAVAAVLLARLALPPTVRPGRAREEPRDPSGRTDGDPGDPSERAAKEPRDPSGRAAGDQRDPSGRVSGDLRGEIREGVRFIRSHRLIGSLTFLGVGNSLAEGAVIGLLVVVAVEQFGLPVQDARIGLLFAAAAVGAMAAGLAVPWLRRRVPTPVISLVALTAVGLLLLAWAFTGHFPLGLVVLALWQGANTLVSLNGIVERQEQTPDHLQGRVNTTARMIAWGGQPAGAALAGVLADLTSPRAALVTVAVTVLLTLTLPPARTLLGLARRTGVTRAGSGP